MVLKSIFVCVFGIIFYKQILFSQFLAVENGNFWVLIVLY